MNNLTKEQKIKILQQLQAGKITAKDLLPKRLRLRISKAGPSFFYNDEPISKEKFEALSVMNKSTKITVRRV